MNNLKTFEEYGFGDPNDPFGLNPINPFNPINPISPYNPNNPIGFEQQRKRREKDEEDRHKRKKRDDEDYEERQKRYRDEKEEIEFEPGDKIMYENPENHHDGEVGQFLSVRNDGKYRIRFDDTGIILAADPDHLRKI
jgi:hypothetical protein